MSAKCVSVGQYRICMSTLQIRCPRQHHTFDTQTYFRFKSNSIRFRTKHISLGVLFCSPDRHLKGTETLVSSLAYRKPKYTGTLSLIAMLCALVFACVYVWDKHVEYPEGCLPGGGYTAYGLLIFNQPTEAFTK